MPPCDWRNPLRDGRLKRHFMSFSDLGLSDKLVRAVADGEGFTISGTSPDGALAELVELRDHPYFLACQYHPEFQSKPNKPHPLFKGFVEACLARQQQQRSENSRLEKVA